MDSKLDREKSLRRVFEGEIPNKDNNFKVSGFEKSHLKGYLNGLDLFRYGFHTDGKPAYYKGLSSWITNEEYNKRFNIWN